MFRMGDSTWRPAENGLTYQILSPRRPKSHWTELNKERVRRLEKMELMTDAGRSVLPDMSTDLNVLFPELMKILKDDATVIDNMSRMPALYLRIRLDGIAWAKISHNGEDYDHRLNKFIEKTREGKMYGDWNDYGRLLL